MSGNLLDDDEIELGIRRHTDDKLTYKLIIANAINECRRSKNNPDEYEDKVHGLINILYFDVRGYKLRTQIEELLTELKTKRENRYKEEEETVERWMFYRKSYQAKFKLKLHKWYYTELFRRILQILASEGLLMDIEKFISVKTTEEQDEEEM